MYAQKGFSILELVITLMLMSILLAIALPAIANSLAVFQLRTASLQLEQDIISLSQKSLVQECDNYYLQLYVGGGRYRIGDISNTGNNTWIELPKWVEIDSSNFSLHRISFSGKGKPSVGGYIRLKNTRSNKYSYIIISPIAGRVRVSDQPPLSNEYL